MNGLRLLALVIPVAFGASCASSSPSAPSSGASRKLPIPPAGPRSAVLAVDPAPPKGLHLPRTALPTKYALKLAIRTDDNKVDGTVAIDLALSAPTNVVWLHGRNLAVKDARFETNDQKTPARVIVDEKLELLGFVAPSTMPAGATKLAVRYEAQAVTNSDRGIFREQEAGDWYVFSQFENTEARSAFPCFDEPSLKVPWDVSLEVPSSQVALSNTRAVSETDAGNGRKLVRFAETKPLPSYLIAFAVGPFQLVDGGKAGRAHIPVQIAAPRGKGAEAAYAAKITSDLVGVLEDYFGVPYPYDKLDVVPIPTLISFAAMENAGLITFFREGMLAKREEETEAFKRRYADIMAHELAHQWFGDLVTMEWWDDIWLNEGFATWMTNKVIAKYRPEWNVDVARVRDDGRAMSTDSLVSARRIRQPIESADDIANAFDAITYEKGAAVLGMFESWIGEDKFQGGIRDYLERHAHGNATSRDFFASISGKAGLDVSPAFSSFLDQPGVPLVGPTLECKAKEPKVGLAQERYLPLGSKGSPAQTWLVPVCMRNAPAQRAASAAKTSDSDKVCKLLEQAKGEMLLPAGACPEMLVRNAGARGYYIAEYTPAVLDGLLRDGAKRLSPAERVALIRDVRALVQAGKLTAIDVLGRLAPLANDSNPSVAREALSWAGEFAQGTFRDELEPKFAHFVRSTFGRRAKALGFDPKSNEDPETRFLRPLIVGFVANRGEDPALVAEAKARAVRWMKDPTSTADEMVDTVLSIAAAHGDKAFFEELRADAKKMEDIKRRRRLLGAMAQFRDRAVVESTFAVLMSDEFDIREAIGLLGHDPKMGPFVFELVTRHYEDIRKRLRSEDIGRLPALFQGFCTEPQRDEVASFFKERSEREIGGARKLANTLESISLCSAFRAYQEPSLASFLAKY